MTDHTGDLDGGATIAADSQSRVFRRGTVTSGETKGAALYYGCSLRSGHIRRLNRRGDFGLNRVTGSMIRLAGPFVGYVENDVEALGVLPFAIVIDVRVVSHSAAIAPHSLALAANSHAIYWTEAGAARTAPVR